MEHDNNGLFIRSMMMTYRASFPVPLSTGFGMRATGGGSRGANPIAQALCRIVGMRDFGESGLIPGWLGSSGLPRFRRTHFSRETDHVR